MAEKLTSSISWRIFYATWGIFVLVTGLLTRKIPDMWPELIRDYGGDTLWAMLVYIGIGFLFPHSKLLHRFSIALLFSFLIEMSQIYQAEWINNVRQSLPGKYILGQGFKWSDLVCYTIGIAVGAGLDLLVARWRQSK